jgi:hypothetical protein
MPKISALPPINTVAPDDETPGNDDSTGQTGKWSFTTLKTWLQSLAAWVSKSNLDFDSGIWWEELGRTTLVSAADTISVQNLAARKNLKIIVVAQGTGSGTRNTLVFNNDTGNNYSNRTETDGGADAATTSAAGNFLMDVGANAINTYGEVYVKNITATEKVYYGQSVNKTATGAGTAPQRRSGVGAWVNTATQITRVDLNDSGPGQYAAGSILIVLGHD